MPDMTSSDLASGGAANAQQGPLHRFRGIPVVVERPLGFVQRGVSKATGKSWIRVYGYGPDGAQIPGFIGYGCIPHALSGDGEDLDVYLGADEGAETAYLIEQGGDDPEHKLFLGWSSEENVVACYAAHTPISMLAGITSVPVALIQALLGVSAGDEVPPSSKSGAVEKSASGLGARIMKALAGAAEVDKAGAYDGIDFSPPKGVKRACARGLALHKEGMTGDGLELATVAWARKYTEGTAVSPERARQGNAFCLRNARFAAAPKDSPAYASWMLWGGAAGAAWFAKLVRQMDAADEKKVEKDISGEGVARRMLKEGLDASERNALPDDAFFYIAPGGEKDEGGKTTPRSLRYLPYRGPDGKPDAVHLRAALAYLSRTEAPGLDAEAKEKIRERATKLLEETNAQAEKSARVEKAAGAPQATFISKAADGELRYVLGIVLEPLDPARGEADTQGDAYTEDEIRKAMWLYMMYFQNVSLQHKIFLNGKVYLVECWQAKADCVIEGSNIRKGTWLAGFYVPDDEVWGMILSGEKSGLSIGGSATKTPI